MKNNRAKLELSEDAMKTYGYRVVDAIVEHLSTQHTKLPVALGSREEMDSLFLEEAPEEGMDPNQVLEFVLDKVMTNSTNLSHPKAYSFVPGPSNYISVMADALATGYNIFLEDGWLRLQQLNLKLSLFNGCLNCSVFQRKREVEFLPAVVPWPT